MPDEPQAPQASQNGSSDIYPILTITPPTHPNRFFAFPVLGIVVKLILLVPVYLWLFLIMLAVTVMLLINSFIVLFTGKYWSVAGMFVLGYMRLIARITVYFTGYSDRYPWFSLQNKEWCVVDMHASATPNRLFAIPMGGGFVRSLLMTPFYLFTTIVSGGVGVAVSLIAWAAVLFRGRYPESIFQLGRDSIRLTLSLISYSSGLSDKYPSFSIDLTHHKNEKVAMIIAGVLLLAWNFLINIFSAILPSSSFS